VARGGPWRARRAPCEEERCSSLAAAILIVGTTWRRADLRSQLVYGTTCTTGDEADRLHSRQALHSSSRSPRQVRSCFVNRMGPRKMGDRSLRERCSAGQGKHRQGARCVPAVPFPHKPPGIAKSAHCAQRRRQGRTGYLTRRCYRPARRGNPVRRRGAGSIRRRPRIAKRRFRRRGVERCASQMFGAGSRRGMLVLDWIGDAGKHTASQAVRDRCRLRLRPWHAIQGLELARPLQSARTPREATPRMSSSCARTASARRGCSYRRLAMVG